MDHLAGRPEDEDEADPAAAITTNVVDLSAIDDDNNDDGSGAVLDVAVTPGQVEDFAAVPRAAFKGSGRSFPNGTSGWRLVSWESNVVAQAAAMAQGDETGLCSSLKLKEWSGAYNLSLPEQHYDVSARRSPFGRDWQSDRRFHLPLRSCGPRKHWRVLGSGT